jgi:hypothetical protein
MASTPSSSPPLSRPTLPSGFKSIEEIQNVPNDQIKAGTLVSVIGFVKDYQPPMQTRGGTGELHGTFELVASIDWERSSEMHI